MAASGSSKSYATERKLFALAVELWDVFTRASSVSTSEGRGGGTYGGTRSISLHRLGPLYADMFGRPLKPPDYGLSYLEDLPREISAISLNEGRFYVTRRRLLEFLVAPVVGRGPGEGIDPGSFDARFTEVTGLDAECVYRISGEKNFHCLAGYLSSGKNSPFALKGSRKKRKLCLNGSSSSKQPQNVHTLSHEQSQKQLLPQNSRTEQIVSPPSSLTSSLGQPAREDEKVDQTASNVFFLSIEVMQ